MYRECGNLAVVLLVALTSAAAIADPPTAAPPANAAGIAIQRAAASDTAVSGTVPAADRDCWGYATYLNFADRGWPGGWYVANTTGSGLDIADDVRVTKPGGATIHCVSLWSYCTTGSAPPYDLTIEFWDACPLADGAHLLWTHTWPNNQPRGWLKLETTMNVVVPETFWCRYLTDTPESGVQLAFEPELGHTGNFVGLPADPPENYTCGVPLCIHLYDGLSLHLYTNEEPLGACCFDTMEPPQCVDGWDEISCLELGGSRWFPYGRCEDFFPPCGQAGACCHPDYTCVIVGSDDCVAPSVWLGGGVACDECPPCVVEYPAGGQQESELCGTSANNGCGATPEAFEDAACGAIICGTCWADGGGRDEDWWKIVLAERKSVTLTVEAEFPLFIGFCCFDPEGSANCDDFTGYIGPYVTTDEICAYHTVTKTCDAGTYYLRIAPWITDGMPCGTGPGPDGEWTYTAVIACDTPPLPPCAPDPLYVNQPDLTSFASGLPSQDYLDGNHSAAADDFVISGRALTSTGTVHWAGFCRTDAYFPVGWEIHFYDDDGTGSRPTGNGMDDPRSTAIYSYVFADGEVATTQLYPGNYWYEADLPLPAVLQTGTKYWVSIMADMARESPYVDVPPSVYPPPPLPYPEPVWHWANHGTAYGAAAVRGVSGSTTWPYWTPRSSTSMFFCLMPYIPPPCPAGMTGDVNGDGTVDNFDINACVYALSHTAGEFAWAYPTGYYLCADCNFDGVVDNFDIAPFVGLLTGGK
ncbi:MAG: dockerin type I repeat-containing protein [Phycisphaerae bacterium]